MVKIRFLNISLFILIFASISVFDKKIHNYQGTPYPEFLQKIKKSKNKEKNLITIMTYNIRFEELDKGKQSWRYRKEKLLNNIILKEPDIISIQEDSKDQVEYLKESLENYFQIGVDEKDLPNERQRNSIFFKKNKFELFHQHSIWLNPEEKKDALGWDSLFPRSANIIILINKETKNKIVISNIHLDHKGRIARIEGMKLVLNYLDKISLINGKEKLPIFLMGDFNEFPYQYTYDVVINRNYIDMWNTCLKNNNKFCTLGEQYFGSFHWYLGTLVNNYFLRKLLMPISYTHSGGKFSQWEQYHIDHMFYINGDFTDIKPIYASMPSDDLLLDNSGIYASDHFPLFAVFKLK